MITLGITGRRRHAASALAVDGRIVAAVSEASVTRVTDAGYRDSGFPVASAAACLRVAGVPADAVGQVVSVARSVAPDAGLVDFGGAARDAWREPLERAGMTALLEAGASRVARPTAHAWQAAAAVAGPSLVLAADLEGSATLFAVRDGAPVVIRELPGVGCLAALVEAMARRLGWPGLDGSGPVEFLELLATTAISADDGRFTTAVSAPDMDAAVIAAAAHRELEDIEAQLGGSLRDTGSLKVAVQRARSSVAASLLERIAAMLSELVGRWRARARVESVVVAGELFSSAAFIARVRARSGPFFDPVPVPEPEGFALGAALAGHGRISEPPITALTLGPVFTETEAKAALENARLDYLYEPRWDRLLARVSALLSRGKVVAWFQGPADFGPRSLGGRSVLADPSDRYVRENINRFLKQREEHAVLPVSLLPHLTAECLDDAPASPWMLTRAAVQAASRDRLRSAVDARGSVTYHTVADQHQPGLADLLRTHHERTGVPALVNTTLAGPCEPIACSPRDAVRTFFSSAIDVLVLHRFLLMKDYWQMRSEGE